MSEVIEKLKELLDDAPMGTLTFLAVVVIVVVAYIQGTINITQAFEYLGWGTGAAAGLGIMRTAAGKGVK